LAEGIFALDPKHMPTILEAYIVLKAHRYAELAIECNKNDSAMNSLADNVFGLLAVDFK